MYERKEENRVQVERQHKIKKEKFLRPTFQCKYFP